MNCPRVLLTGANGFIGAHVLDVLLKNGAFVQAIVRGPEKAARLRKDFSAFEKTRLDFSIVPDITVEGCFDKCMQECQPLDAVVHTAAPLAPTEFSKSLGPMLQGTLEILRSVSRHAPTVKRVVITGSFSSIGNVLDIQNGGIVYSSDSWNPITMEQAKFSHGEVAYWAGKTIAEKAAWEFVQNEKPPFELVVLCPTAVYGPLRHSIDSIKDLNSSNNHLYENFFASSKELPVPEDYVQSSVDVRDLATAHYQACFAPSVGNRRYLVTAGENLNQEISDIMREAFPDRDRNIPLGNPGNHTLGPEMFRTDNALSKEVLGVSYRPFRETLVDVCRYFLEMEAQDSSA